MKKILVIYHNTIFLEFIKKFLERNSFHVITTKFGDSIFNTVLKEMPNLIIASNKVEDLNVYAFLHKRLLSSKAKYIPVYLVGKFAKNELVEYKDKKVTAYITPPINPYSLLEKIKTQFKIPADDKAVKTPMIVDVNIKGKIVTIQLEGNLEVEKIDVMNYKIRLFCLKHKITQPRFLYIFPSMYPETITKYNIDALFDFLHFDELSIKPSQIKILTKVHSVIDGLRNDPVYAKFEIVNNYLEGIEKLNIDFDKSSKIPVAFIKPGMHYVLDLYDPAGRIVVSAGESISQQHIDDLLALNIKSLTYYSDKGPSEIFKTGKQHIQATAFDKALGALSNFETMENPEELTDDSNQKMELFFNKIIGHSALIISQNSSDTSVISNTLSKYLKIKVLSDSVGLTNALSEENYMLCFIDLDLPNNSAINILKLIRSKVSKKQTTVIMTATSIDKNKLGLLKANGTDYLIMSPLEKNQLMKKVYHFITSDRSF